jgi:hypothetical protein
MGAAIVHGKKLPPKIENSNRTISNHDLAPFPQGDVIAVGNLYPFGA